MMDTTETRKVRVDSAPEPDEIEARIRRYLRASCPYAQAFRDVSVECNGHVARLRGRVGSFYLKQLLQTFVGKLDGVECVENDVDVVSCSGLSSVRPR